MEKKEVFVLVIIIMSFFIGLYLYPKMPDMMDSHWNYHGAVNSTIPKFWGVFLMPIITLTILLGFIFIPKIDPLKKNIDKFRRYFDNFIIAIILFLFYIYLLTVLWNLGLRFNMATMILPAIGILIYCVGILIEKSKRNWFIGIKTPWTLSSDKVWGNTHKLGGKLFKFAGILSILSIFAVPYALFLIIVTVILIVIYLFIYSYFEFKKS